MVNDEKDNLPQFMTIKAVAQHLGISKQTVYRYIHQPDNPLPFIYLVDHKSIRIPWDQFNLWLDSKQSGGDTQ